MASTELGTPSVLFTLRLGQVGLDDACVASCHCNCDVAVGQVDKLLVSPHHVLLLALCDQLLDKEQSLLSKPSCRLQSKRHEDGSSSAGLLIIFDVLLLLCRLQQCLGTLRTHRHVS